MNAIIQYNDLQQTIKKEFEATQKPVAISAIARKTKSPPDKVKKTFIVMGWIGRQWHGHAPQSYWDQYDKSRQDKQRRAIATFEEKYRQPLAEGRREEAIEFAPPVVSKEFVVESYYYEIRKLWDSIRSAGLDEQLVDLREEISSFKESTRQHLSEVMKRL